MKRKQFHLSEMEEEVLRTLSKETGKSEAEIVREAIKEYGENRGKMLNPLVRMAKEAQKDRLHSEEDLSAKHDQYLAESLENER